MRLNRVNGFVFAVIWIGLAAPAMAQRAVPPGSGQTFKDTSMLKPPPGVRVAIFELEDLECPACARAFPMVRAAAEHYNIPVVRKDFPLPGHIWSFDAAIWARYIQDKISPKTAEEYRRAVFAAQISIGSRDDMLTFTRRFFQSRKLDMPFYPDPMGRFKKEVLEDRALGDKLGVTTTPTIFVCSQHEWVQVTDPTQLYQTIEMVESQVAAAAPAKRVNHPER